MSPLERAARAHFGARIANPDYDGAVSQADLEQARAVIEAIREPSDPMITAGAAESPWRKEHGESTLRNEWRAMIDAALKE